MPNVKIYVDEGVYPACRDSLAKALRPLRDMLCDSLQVPAPACQFAVLPVLAMADLPPVNVEIQIMPHAERTRERLLLVCEALRDIVGGATAAHVAVRMTTLDPVTYIALK